MANENDAVGYGKPPRHTRFQKGKSGNPGGRPKSNMTIVQALSETLQETVVVTDKGKRKRFTKAQVIANRLVHKAGEGNVAAIAHIDKIMSRVSPETPEDRELVATLDFQEPAVRRPDFTMLAEILLLEHGEALPPDIREKIEQMTAAKSYLLAHDHLLPRSLKDLSD